MRIVLGNADILFGFAVHEIQIEVGGGAFCIFSIDIYSFICICIRFTIEATHFAYEVVGCTLCRAIQAEFVSSVFLRSSRDRRAYHFFNCIQITKGFEVRRLAFCADNTNQFVFNFDGGSFVNVNFRGFFAFYKYNTRFRCAFRFDVNRPFDGVGDIREGDRVNKFVVRTAFFKGGIFPLQELLYAVKIDLYRAATAAITRINWINSVNATCQTKHTYAEGECAKNVFFHVYISLL